MQLGNFRTLVCDFMNRDPALFGVGVGGQQDKIVAAMNMAKAWAQRTHEFEHLQAQAEVTVDKTAGVALSTAHLAGTSTDVLVRTIKRAFVNAADGSGVFPIDVLTREEQTRMLQRNTENLNLSERKMRNLTVCPPGQMYLVQHGTQIYLWPWSTDLTGGATTWLVYLDIIKRLPDYDPSVTTDEDIFLSECLDWMMFRTVFYANMFLKDDMRAPITAEVIKDAWEAVLNWDASIVQGATPID